MIKMTFEDFQEMDSENRGYCRTCDFVGTDGLEPDATDCMCHYCKAETVDGAQTAFEKGDIIIVDEGDVDELFI